MAWFALVLPPLLLALACEGPPGPPGRAGPAGPRGDAGTAGSGGLDGGLVREAWITGPGLGLKLVEGDVTHVRYRVTDAAGVPLDVAGRLSDGAVTVRFVLAWLDVDELGRPTTYTSYTVRRQTSMATGQSADQAAVDGAGVTTYVADGVYEYRFATQVDTPMPRSHRVAAYATRVTGGLTYVANATLDFVPGGGVPLGRAIVTDAACNLCHDRLEAHGGSRREVGLCITCHSPQTVDPDSGNSLDMTTMVHKIHRGAGLPSVVAGTPYQIIGFGDSVHDFSTVHFPHAVEHCESCHDGPQGPLFAERPSRAACSSCHDRTSFDDPAPEGFTLHGGGAQGGDATCATCHPPSGGIAGIRDVHLLPADNPANPRLALEILSVTGASPGATPEMTFVVTDRGVPRDILAAPLGTLRVTVAGPTSDYARYWQATIQGTGASGTLSAVDAANGIFRYLLPDAAAMPLDATGSYDFALEGNVQLPAGRFAAVGPVVPVAVTDAAPVPRRLIVEEAACNRCHLDVQGHGGSRKGVRSCVLCHNGENANDERVARLEGSTVLAESLDLKVMIHKIHRGEALQRDYVLGGNPTPTTANPAGTPVDFGHLRYPGALRVCSSCHQPGTFELPLAESIRPSRSEILACTEDPIADADDFCASRTVTPRYLLPTRAVCTSCHDGSAADAHAQVTTTVMGVESCVTCHGPGSAFDPARAHTLDRELP